VTTQFQVKLSGQLKVNDLLHHLCTADDYLRTDKHANRIHTLIRTGARATYSHSVGEACNWKTV